jgi:hypothetical protein
MKALSSLIPPGWKIDDGFSPILVKEVRQGMRARVFVLSFLMLQMFLILVVVANVVAQADTGALQTESYYFWTVIGFALLALMPLRGLVTVSLEVKNRTMETVLLTRLTAWRVVFGKWSALFAQSLLLVSAVLPYVVLRYFIGGNDIVSDLELMLFLLWLSGILIATSIAVSALANVVIRVVLIVGVVIMNVVGLNVIGMGGGFAPGFRMSGWETMGWLVLVGFFVPALLFEITASTLAPASENHAIRRRSYAVLFFLLACALEAAAHSDFKPGVGLPLIILIGICYYELSEKPQIIPRMVQSLARFGPLARIGALFLLPGWPSAFLFSILVIPASICGAYLFLGPSDLPDLLFLILATLGSVLMPVVLCHLFWRKMNQVLLMVVLYNLLFLGASSILQGFAALTQAHFDPILAFFPSLPVLTLTENEPNGGFKEYSDWYLFGNLTVLGILTVIFLAQGTYYFREVFALFRTARPPAPAPDQPAP